MMGEANGTLYGLSIKGVPLSPLWTAALQQLVEISLDISYPHALITVNPFKQLVPLQGTPV